MDELASGAKRVLVVGEERQPMRYHLEQTGRCVATGSAATIVLSGTPSTTLSSRLASPAARLVASWLMRRRCRFGQRPTTFGGMASDRSCAWSVLGRLVAEA